MQPRLFKEVVLCTYLYEGFKNWERWSASIHIQIKLNVKIEMTYSS